MSNTTIELDNNQVTKTLVKFSIPAIFALLIQSLYNLVDAIYVGHAIGSIGITALTIFYPVQILMISIANFIAIGGGALVSIALGKKEYKYANNVACNVITALILLGISLSILCLIFMKHILYFIGCSELSYPYVYNYAVIVFSGITVSLLLQGTYSLLRAEGKLKLIMWTTITSVTLNTILNPIFLFVLNMGMQGVSIATLLSQLAVLAILAHYYIKGKAKITLRLKDFIPDVKILSKSALYGTSSMVRMSGAAFLNVFINHIAKQYGGAEGIASYGLAYRLIIFMFMPILGFIQGGQPLLGYNHGAGNGARIRKVLASSMTITIAISFIMILLVVLFGENIIHAFTNNQQILTDSPKYLFMLTLALPLIAYQAIISGYMQAVGRITASNITTVIRQFLFFIPTILILSSCYQMKGLSSSYLISNIFSFTIIFLWMQYEKRSSYRE